MTRGGRHRQSQAEKKRDNAEVGSSFFRPIICTPNVKENNGVMHTPCGHINHFWESVCGAIVKKMKGGDWETAVNEALTELKTRIESTNAKIKACRQDEAAKVSSDCGR